MKGGGGGGDTERNRAQEEEQKKSRDANLTDREGTSLLKRHRCFVKLSRTRQAVYV